MEEALKENRMPVLPFEVRWEYASGRFKISNPLKGENEDVAIWSRESLQRWPPVAGDEPLFPNFDRHRLRDTNRQLGLVDGSSAFSHRYVGKHEMTMSSVPRLLPQEPLHPRRPRVPGLLLRPARVQRGHLASGGHAGVDKPYQLRLARHTLRPYQGVARHPLRAALHAQGHGRQGGELTRRALALQPRHLRGMIHIIIFILLTP